MTKLPNNKTSDTTVRGQKTAASSSPLSILKRIFGSKIFWAVFIIFLIGTYFAWVNFQQSKRDFLEGVPVVKTADTISTELRSVYDLKDPKPYVWIVTNPAKLSSANIPLLAQAKPGDKVFMFNEKSQSGTDTPSVVVLYRTSDQRIVGSVKLDQKMFEQVKAGN